MTLYLSHESALRYWLTRAPYHALPDCAPEHTLQRASAGMAEIKNASLPYSPSPKTPLHLLMPGPDAHRDRSIVRPHVQARELPPGSFLSLIGDVRVSSPELTYLQLAARRPLSEVVTYGCYLCAGFCVDEDGSYLGLRDHLTTTQDIATYLGKVPEAYGASKARRALGYVVGNTASPMEVMLAVLLSLPVREGGWEMPRIVANQRIDIDEELRPLADAECYFGDLLIPTVNGDLEYDSVEFHSGSFRLDHTQARRNVLEAMGIRTVSATIGQIADARRFDHFMYMVRRRFGLEQIVCSLEESERQHRLHDILLTRERGLF